MSVRSGGSSLPAGMSAAVSSTGGESASPTPEIRSIPKLQGDRRTPIKHILIGTPQIVAFTTRRLEQAGYA